MSELNEAQVSFTQRELRIASIALNLMLTEFTDTRTLNEIIRVIKKIDAQTLRTAKTVNSSQATVK